MEEISEEHVVHVRFRDPRDRLHGVNHNYSVKLRVKKSRNKAHAEAKVDMHMRRSGYVITSKKTKVVPKKVKKLKEEIELSELSQATLKSYNRQAKGEHQPLSAAWRIHRKAAKDGRAGSAEWAKKLDKKVTNRDKGIRLADAKMKEDYNMDEDVAGMDLRKHIYASNSSGGVTIHQDASKKPANYFHSRHPGKPANGKFKLRLVKNEELEMDEPANNTCRPLSDILKVGNKVREWTNAHTVKSPDRNGNGDDVFSATGLKRASYPRATPDPEISEEVENIDEISRGKLFRYHDAAVADLHYKAYDHGVDSGVHGDKYSKTARNDARKKISNRKVYLGTALRKLTTGANVPGK